MRTNNISTSSSQFRVRHWCAALLAAWSKIRLPKILRFRLISSGPFYWRRAHIIGNEALPDPLKWIRRTTHSPARILCDLCTITFIHSFRASVPKYHRHSFLLSVPFFSFSILLINLARMKGVTLLGLLAGIWTLVFADTCNVAPAKLAEAYVGPNGIEDPTGGKSRLQTSARPVG